MAWLKWLALGSLALALTAFGIAAAMVRTDYALVPAESEVLNGERLPVSAAYDVLGRAVSAEEAERLLRTVEGRRMLAPASGAVRLDEGLIASGRRDFYGETFGSEAFLSDVLGFLDGGLSAKQLALALLELGGAGTTDLRVRLAANVVVGGTELRAGETISTGLDVPRGAYLPLGLRFFYDRGRVRVGATCALCHATVDRASGRVVEGAPNADLRAGLLLALSSNPAALIGLAGIGSLAPYLTRPENIVRTSSGPSAVLPDPGALARDVRAALGSWPAGSFDSTFDSARNPTSIPSSFTAFSHPYGWSGQAMAGPFRGLWSLRNTGHGLQADPVSLAPSAPGLFGLDREVYLGTLLQDAAAAHLRFDPRAGRIPSDLVSQGGIVGVNRAAILPSYPRPSYVSVNGLATARAGEPRIVTADRLAGHGLPAFQNRLRPPPAEPDEPDRLSRGREVFERAGCAACHSGPALTSNRVWPVAVLGTEPSRARAFAGYEAGVAAPAVFAADTPVPPPADAAVTAFPVADMGQLKLAWGHNRTGGGYKVPSLVGLAWTAPYLHDGGVAVGAGAEPRFGAAELARARAVPDPRNSLRALVDRSWRARVLAANRDSADLRSARVTGEGHAFWIDGPAGYSPEEQEAAIAYLLSLDRPEAPP